jgi:hypothetical protein
MKRFLTAAWLTATVIVCLACVLIAGLDACETGKKHKRAMVSNKPSSSGTVYQDTGKGIGGTTLDSIEHSKTEILMAIKELESEVIALRRAIALEKGKR